MGTIKHYLHAEIDLSNPVPDVCAGIAAVLQAYPGKEHEILIKLQEAINGHLKVIEKGVAKSDKPIR